MSDWQKAFAVEELVSGQAKLFRYSPRQIAVFRVKEKLFAIDNRCPHEGYPLVDGQVDSDGCLLTCVWHNWKFKLDDGECVLGGDHVRSYDVKEEDGHVWVDVADSPEQVARVIEGLQQAFGDRDFGRICREISRLHFMGQQPDDAVREAVRWSYDKLEFGTTHAYAAMADWLRRYHEYEGDWERQLICLSETVDHTAFDVLRQREFAYHEANGHPEFCDKKLLEAVEQERRADAEGLIQLGLQQGKKWHDWEVTLATAALSHFNDFGHSAIYIVKMGQLIEALGEELHGPVALALIRSLCYTTREDLLPAFSTHQETMEVVQASGFGDSSEDLVDPFPCTVAKGHDWLIEAAKTHRPETIYWALEQAICKSLLHYDTKYETTFSRPVTDNVTWLFFTHGITFSNAVRILCERYPQLWPQGLSQMVCMLGRNHRFLDLEQDIDRWIVADEPSFWEEVKGIELDHGFRDPIFSAHIVKTAVAIEEESALAPSECKQWLLAALNCFLHSPIKQKHTRRLARQAIDLVQRDYS